MATKRNRPVDKSTQSDQTSERGNKRLTNSSREINKNEEQTSPSGRNKASEQRHQRAEDMDHSIRRQTERPETSQWNQGTSNQTIGSDRPGSEISDRKPNAESWNQTSRDEYPKHSKSSPNMQEDDSKAQPHMQEKADRRVHTGNAERTGQQYSANDSTSLSGDKNLRSGHPANDRELSQEPRDKRKAKSANQGTKQSRGETTTRQQKQDKMNPDDQVLEE